jgi:hypothetical protein
MMTLLEIQSFPLKVTVLRADDPVGPKHVTAWNESVRSKNYFFIRNVLVFNLILIIFISSAPPTRCYLIWVVRKIIHVKYLDIIMCIIHVKYRVFFFLLDW